MCELVGAGLATVLTDADYVALNATVHQNGARGNGCTGRMYMGAKSSGNYNWTWQTGDPLSTSWAYWEPGQPDSADIVCMRAIIMPGVPVTFLDQVCGNRGLNCFLCDA